MSSLSLGQTVVHPHHGAARVDEFEEREFNGEQAEYVVLRLSMNDLTLKIPHEACDDIGIRTVIGDDEVERVLDILGGEADTSNEHWSRRLKRNQRRLRSGEPSSVAQVVRDLSAKEIEKGLSPAEKRLRDKARLMLTGELVAATDRELEQVEQMIDDAMALEPAEA